MMMITPPGIVGMCSTLQLQMPGTYTWNRSQFKNNYFAEM